MGREIVSIRLDAEDVEALRVLAERADKPLSNLVRDFALTGLRRSAEDHLAGVRGLGDAASADTRALGHAAGADVRALGRTAADRVLPSGESALADHVALMDRARPRTFSEKVAVAQALADTWLRELAREADDAEGDPGEAIMAASVFKSYAEDVLASIESLSEAARQMRADQGARG